MLEDVIITQLLQTPEQKWTGPKLAALAGVSRNAIWKAIENLRQKGYTIDSSPQSGYRLTQLPTQIEAHYLKYLLNDLPLTVHTYPSIDSTNNEAKRLATDQTHNLLLIASQQTAGRGRLGRDFQSDLTHGLYVSLKLTPNISDMTQLPFYTLLTAAAVTETLQPYLEDKLSIKWINDLFYHQRKVAGILCESIVNMETQTADAVVLGCGLNLAGDFSHSTHQEVAGTLFGETLPDSLNQNQLLAQIIHKIYDYHHHLLDKGYLETYRHHLLGLNQTVHYQINQHQDQGTIRGISNDGELLIEKRNGTIEKIFNERIHFGSEQFAK